jgi:hypothetical protein
MLGIFYRLATDLLPCHEKTRQNHRVKRDITSNNAYELIKLKTYQV